MGHEREASVEQEFFARLFVNSDETIFDQELTFKNYLYSAKARE